MRASFVAISTHWRRVTRSFDFLAFEFLVARFICLPLWLFAVDEVILYPGYNAVNTRGIDI